MYLGDAENNENNGMEEMVLVTLTSGAEAVIFQQNWVVDALAPSDARSSTAMILNV